MTQIMLGSALQQVAGPLADFAQKLSGPEGNTKWLPAFKRFLRGENPWDGKPLFAPWKTITIGQRANGDEMLQALRDQRVSFGSVVERAIQEATYSSVRTEVDLVKVSVESLGFPGHAHYANIRRRMKQLGLEPCTMEIVAEARLAYEDQEGDMLDVLLREPPKTKDGHLLPDLRVDDDTGDLYIAGVDEEDNIPGPKVEILCVLPRN